MKNYRRKTTWLHLFILLILVGAAVQSMTWAGWLASPERMYSDLWHRLAGVRYQPQHVAIVTLDDIISVLHNKTIDDHSIITDAIKREIDRYRDRYGAC